MGPTGALRGNEMDDTLTVKRYILLQARSVKDAFVLNHQYTHRYYTLGIELKPFNASTYTPIVHIHMHTKRSLPPFPLSSEVIPWVVVNYWLQNRAVQFKYVCSTESHMSLLKPY